MEIVEGRVEGDEVTEDWLSETLKLTVAKDTLKWSREKGKEEGPLSNVTRINFIKTTSQGVREPCHLIAKLLPKCEDGELVMSHQLHVNEIQFYSKILPDILSEFPDFEKYVSPFVYGNCEENRNGSRVSILLLQDLKPRGYSRKPFNQQMTYPEFDQGILFLSQLHFATLALQDRKGMKLPEIYPWLPNWYRPNPDPLIHSILIQESFPLGFDKLEKFLPETHRHAFVDLKRSAGKIFEKVLEAGQEFPTGIHGALWQNNLIVHTSSSTQETEGQEEVNGAENGVKGDEGRVKVIDWEMMGYADPLFDLAIYILTSFPEEQLSIIAVELTILRYTEEVNKLLTHKTESDGRDLAKLSKIRTDFHENLQFFNTYGLAYAFIWLTMSCESILKVEGNEERLVNIFKFLHDDMDLPAFLYSIL